MTLRKESGFNAKPQSRGDAGESHGPPTSDVGAGDTDEAQTRTDNEKDWKRNFTGANGENGGISDRPLHRMSGRVRTDFIDGKMRRNEQPERNCRLSGSEEDKRVIRLVTQHTQANSRVKVIKDSRELVIRGLKSPVSTRIRRVETRIKPLKATQVVDFPHIEENKGRKEDANFMIAWRLSKLRSGKILRGLSEGLTFAGHLAHYAARFNGKNYATYSQHRHHRPR